METSDHMNIDIVRKMHRWRMAFFGAVILLAGIVIGGASMMMVLPHRLMAPPPGPEFDSLRMLPSLRRDLDLTTEQSKRISPILETHMRRLGEIRSEARAEIAETLKQMNDEICEILTDRQERLWKRSLERLQRGLRPGPGGPGRRGEGSGGMRQRRGQQGRRGRGMQGRWRRPTGTNGLREAPEPNSNQTQEKTDANDME